MVINWQANSEPDWSGYQLYRSEAEAGPFRLLTRLTGSITETVYRDTDVQRNQTYWYQITAFDWLANELASFRDGTGGCSGYYSACLSRLG